MVRTFGFASVPCRLVVATVVALAYIPGANAQGKSRRSSLELVERLMSLAFPGVGQAPNTLGVSFQPYPSVPWTRPFELSVHVYRPGEWPLVGERAIDERHSRVLGAQFRINPRVERFEFVNFVGELVHSKVMADMHEVLIAHPNPSDADVLAMLADQRAKYPPSAREAFLKRWNLREFDSVLGAIDEIDVTFFWRQPNFPPGRQNVGMPIWEARIKSERRSWCSTLAFEPIDGNLMSLSGSPCSNR